MTKRAGEKDSKMIDETKTGTMSSSFVKIFKPCSNSDIKLSALCLVGIVIISLICIFLLSGSYTHKSVERAGFELFSVRRPPPPPPHNSTSSWIYNWDRQDPKTYPKGSPLHGNVNATRTLVLIRHGQYGSTGELTSLGRKQAELTGKRLAEMGWIYDEIIHSTMIRAAQTAQIITKHIKGGVPMKHDALLREGGPVPPDPTVTYFQLPNLDYYLDGPRIESAFKKYFHRAEPSQNKRTNQILVGHSNIFKYFILRTLQFPRDGWMRFFIPHGSISVLSIAPEGTVSSGHIGDAGYMPVGMVTY